MRFIHRPIKKVTSLSSMYYHGHASKENYYSPSGGGQTKKADPRLEEMLDKINEVNFEYMNSKWGPNWRSCSPTVHPFNHDTIPISYTSYDLNYVRSKNLGF
jgi:hypothetical protein